jgi:hypothetical protein
LDLDPRFQSPKVKAQSAETAPGIFRYRYLFAALLFSNLLALLLVA